MCRMISCLVDREGRVYAKDGVHSHTQLAEIFEVDEDKCLKYEFALDTRTLVQDFHMDCAPFEAKQSHDQAAQRFFDECAGTPEKLMVYVQRGNWDETVLPCLLTITSSARVKYDNARAAAKAKYDKACDAAGAKYDKACDAARTKYDKACDAAWAKYKKVCVKTWLQIFKNPENRIEIWKK